MPLERAKDHRGVIAHDYCAPVLRISDAVRVWINSLVA